MRLLKPQPAARLNPAHPLARGLAACWLMNEGAGDATYDYAHALTATGDPAPAWGPDRCDFNGVDQVFFADNTIDLEKDFTIVAEVRVESVSLEHTAVGMGDPTYGCRFSLGCFTSGKYRCLFREDNNTNIVNVYDSGNAFDDGQPHQLAFTFALSTNAYHCFVDGAVIATSTPSDYTAIHAGKLSIGSSYRLGTFSNHWPGSVYYAYVYGRALTPAEIAQLHREPYVLFEGPALLAAAALTAGNVYDLSGELAASSTASASLTVSAAVTLSGTIQAVAALAGSLQMVPANAAEWLTDALLNGMTAQAFKLGTALTRGWFWVRREGCSVVYRGPSIGAVDFDSMLCVVDPQTRPIPLPAHLTHEPGATYCYVLRRFNSCGHQELTTAAAVIVDIGPDGKLADPTPNEVFGLEAERTDGSGIRLRWFHCPLDQKTRPNVFNVYGDGGTGQVDFEAALATIRYEGRRFYRYQTGALEPGRYTFVVRAQSATGAERVTLATVRCTVEACAPEAATILAAEAIS